MARLLEMYVALAALSFDFVTTCQDGKFAAFLHFVICLFYLFIFFFFIVIIVIFYCVCFDFLIQLFLRFNFDLFHGKMTLLLPRRFCCEVDIEVLQCMGERRRRERKTIISSQAKVERLQEILIALLNKTPALLVQLLCAQLQSKKASNAWRLAP